MAKHLSMLNKILDNTFCLYFKSQNYHWIIKGENFYSLHALLGEHYDALYKFVDEIAERIVAQGGKVDIGLSSMKSKIKDAEHGLKSNNILKDLAMDHELCISEIKAVLPNVQKAGDEVSFDMLVNVLSFHEKAIWMLKAHL